MRQFVTSLLLCILAFLCGAQGLGDLEYKIDVRLNAEQNLLEGNCRIFLHNNTADTLSELGLLLYPNAYSSRTTAFARQQLLNGNLDFYFGEEDHYGRISGLDMTVRGKPVAMVQEPDDPDLAKVRLNELLLPGDTLTLSTPFLVDIPRFSSRLGHENNSFFITQWYPKIAMYTEGEGWHMYPYLDLGEYYSPFADYKVRIDVPEGFQCASTGLDEGADYAGHAGRSLYEFEAIEVIDFAWFASADFKTDIEVVTIDGRDIVCRAVYTEGHPDFWRNASVYIAEAVRFYSETVGPYPYDHATVVAGPDQTYGGMEYPAITLVGGVWSARELDQVIAHEIGHNWFYAALATDERRFAWMDEGINTYYEDRYMKSKYGTFVDEWLPDLMKTKGSMSDRQLLLQEMARTGRLGSPAADPAAETDLSYMLNAYTKPALAFHMLDAYIGRDKFDQAMQSYYSRWKFKHPSPADLREVLEEFAGENLDWLFDGLLSAKGLPDYELEWEKSTQTASARNQVGPILPTHLVASSGDSIAESTWSAGAVTAPEFKVSTAGVQSLLLFDTTYSLDANPDDNVVWLKTNGSKKRRVRIGLPGKTRVPGVKQISVLPALAGNVYDKVMLGAYFSNLTWPMSNLNWTLIPMYSTGAKSVVGIGSIYYDGYPVSGNLNSWRAGISTRSFHYNYNDHYDFRDRYFRVTPEVKFNFKPNSRADAPVHSVGYRFIYVRQDYGQGIDFDDKIWERKSRDYYVNELSYNLTGNRTLTPYKLNVIASQGKGFARLTADYRQKIIYNRRKHAFHFHGFAGWLPQFDSPDANILLYYNGISSSGFYSNDYAYDELLLGRNEEKGFYSQQVFTKDAGVKTLYNGGISSDWMASAGVAVDLPLPVPLRPYFDLVLSPEFSGNGTRVDYSGGVAVILLDEIIEVYFPIVESKNIRESLTYTERPGYFQRVTFLLDLNKLDPKVLLGKILD